MPGTSRRGIRKCVSAGQKWVSVGKLERQASKRCFDRAYSRACIVADVLRFNDPTSAVQALTAGGKRSVP